MTEDKPFVAMVYTIPCFQNPTGVCYSSGLWCLAAGVGGCPLMGVSVLSLVRSLQAASGDSKTSQSSCRSGRCLQPALLSRT